MELRYFILRRILLLVPTLVGITIMAFIFLRLFPTSTLLSQFINRSALSGGASYNALLAQANAQEGFNYPLPVQYFYFLINLFQGNWGFTEYPLEGPVHKIISLLWPNTAQFLIFTLILSIGIGVPLGSFLGSRRGTYPDKFGRMFALVGLGIPPFFFALILLIAFGRGLTHWPGAVFPLYGSVTIPIPPPKWLYNYNLGLISSTPTHMIFFDALIHGNMNVAWSAFIHMILPVAVITYTMFGIIVVTMRAEMISVARSEYIKTALSKGVPRKTIVKVHSRRNAMLPTVTVIGLIMSYLITGLVVVEYVFQYNGLGWFIVESIIAKTSYPAFTYEIYPIVYTSLLFGVIMAVTSIATDIVYAYIDPRVRY